MYPFQFHEIGTLSPPLGLAYLAAVLEEQGYKDIRLIDCFALNMNLTQLQKEILQIKLDFIGINLYNCSR